MSKKKIIIGVIFFIILFLIIRTIIVVNVAINFYHLYNQDEKYMNKLEQNLGSSRWMARNNDDSIPEFVKKLVPNDNESDIFDKLKNSFDIVSNYSHKNIYDSSYKTDLLENIDKDLKDSNKIDFDRLESNLNEELKKLKTVQKNREQPSIEESKDFSTAPTYRTTRKYVHFWSILSRLYERNNKPDAALSLSQFSFYFIRDMETNYCNSCSLINKSVTNKFKEYTCDSILIWASTPKPESKNLSKSVSKDVLYFVKTEYPLTNAIKYEKTFATVGINALLKTIGWGMQTYCDSDKVSNKLDNIYKEPLLYYDKPLYEIKDKLKKSSEIFENSLKDAELTWVKIFPCFFNTANFVIDTIISFSTPNLKKLKENHESTIAKMEMTVIALAINSYYCEKNKLPKSMDELSSWFGEKLPVNRLTGEPYEIQPDQKHIIQNDGLDGKADTYDDLFFEFNIK